LAIIEKIQALASHPRPAGYAKLHGADDLYRVRQGDYRIIYQILDKALVVIVVKIGHRKEVYRKKV
jgi:mRNA interferase RelE/StbE